jgi:cell division protein FtsI/penicillin-binding protein 2
VAGRRTHKLVLAGAAAVLVVMAAIPAGWYVWDRDDRRRLHAAVDGFAAAWHGGTLSQHTYQGAAGTEVARQAAAVTAGLTPAATDLPAVVEVREVSGPRQGRATARLAVRWDLAQHRTWAYETSIGLVRVGRDWQVAWSPAVIHPKLVEGQVLTARRVPAERGRILGSGGQVLVEPRPVVVVGVQPSRTKNPRATAAAVAAVVDVDAAGLAKRIAASAPDTFVDVITLRRDDYDAVRSRLQPIPGTVFREMTLSLAPSATFARNILGTAGIATAERIKESGDRVQAGDVTGLSGVQRRYDEQLSGTAGLTVTAVNPDADAEPVTLHAVDPVPGQDLRLSLDQTVQQAAETALAAATKPAGLVAIRPSTGEVLAVANGPAAAAGYNRALIGQYPPGSTFKIATTFALLQNGLAPSTPVPCPPTLDVGGRVFQNAENEKLGTVPFSTDFAHSCNTAFVGLSRRITPEQLHDAAFTLGYGRPNTLGVDAFTGAVPRSGDAVAHAADSIGQGKVLASPLTVATVSASVAAGRYVPPRLVLGTGPTPGAPTARPADTPSPDTPGVSTDTPGTATGAPPPAESTPLPAEAIAHLRDLTGLVVTNGTGSALRAVPGEPVHGKTGTAEFGSANPPPTHAWFTGYQGDLAFAVVVEGGGFGGKVAAPLVATFLTALA